MSLLSDYRRCVEEPHEAKLNATIAALRSRVAELEARPAPKAASPALGEGDLEAENAVLKAIREDDGSPCISSTRSVCRLQDGCVCRSLSRAALAALGRLGSDDPPQGQRPADREPVGDAFELAAQACEEQARLFLSAEYALPQPLGSFSERYACSECAKAIRALSNREGDGAETQKTQHGGLKDG